MKRLIESLAYKLISVLKDDDPASVYSKDCVTDPRATFGDFTYGAPTIFDWGEGKHLYVGKYCSIASYVKIMLGGGHRTDWISTYPFNVLSENFPNAIGVEGHPVSKGDIVIGNDVWIGQGATILSGVTIGDGAVIGAYSVVAKDVEPYAIVVGNPARTLRKRFSEDHIKSLLALKWWDWPPATINKHVRVLMSGDLDKLIQLGSGSK